MRNVLLIIGMFIITTVLAPVMWNLWIYAGTGNANFFYAVTLAYSTAQVYHKLFHLYSNITLYVPLFIYLVCLFFTYVYFVSIFLHWFMSPLRVFGLYKFYMLIILQF